MVAADLGKMHTRMDNTVCGAQRINDGERKI